MKNARRLYLVDPQKHILLKITLAKHQIAVRIIIKLLENEIEIFRNKKDEKESIKLVLIEQIFCATKTKRDANATLLRFFFNAFQMRVSVVAPFSFGMNV